MFYLFIYKGKGLGLFFFLRENTINFNLAEADDCNFSSHGWLPFVASKKKKLTTSIGNKVGKKEHSFSHKDSSLHGKEAVCYLVHQALKSLTLSLHWNYSPVPEVTIIIHGHFGEGYVACWLLGKLHSTLCKYIPPLWQLGGNVPWFEGIGMNIPTFCSPSVEGSWV